MAKRKTPKGEKIVDLKPKAEKITEEQLKELRSVVTNLNRAQMDIGSIEVRKHEALHAVLQMQMLIEEMRKRFKDEYGSDDINIADGTIKYNENDTNEANKKDNDREGL